MVDFNDFEEIKGNDRFNNSNYNSNGGGNGQENNWSNRSSNQGYRGNGGNNSGRNNSWGNGGNKFYKKKDDKPFNPEDVSLYLPFVATGNRNIPDTDLERMIKVSKMLVSKGFTLRTGGLDGPDSVLSEEITSRELYLPWKNFSNKESKLYFNTKDVLEIAKRHHPAWNSLKSAVQSFLGMNVRMVLGKDMKSPAMFILGWSEDGAELNREKTSKTGNFGHVVALASSRKIPVFNFLRSDAEERLIKYLESDTDGQKKEQNEQNQYNQTRGSNYGNSEQPTGGNSYNGGNSGGDTRQLDGGQPTGGNSGGASSYNGGGSYGGDSGQSIGGSY